MTLPIRKHTRLKDYDYSQPGAYFVTVCTLEKRCTLGQVCVGPDALIGPYMQLTRLGQCLEQAIISTRTVYPCVTVEYVIMPNHFHAVFTFSKIENGPMGASGPTLGMVVRGIKTKVTRWAGHPVWQESYYEHVVRNEEDYLCIQEYMQNNPARWAEDEYYA